MGHQSQQILLVKRGRGTALPISTISKSSFLNCQSNQIGFDDVLNISMYNKFKHQCLGPLYLLQCVIEALSVTQDVITSPIRKMKRDAVAGRYMSPLFRLLKHFMTIHQVSFSKHFFVFFLLVHLMLNI